MRRSIAVTRSIVRQKCVHSDFNSVLGFGGRRQRANDEVAEVLRRDARVRQFEIACLGELPEPFGQPPLDLDESAW